jgi:methylated-DNA-protein-cysteine methyltransferase-like protein
MIPPGTVATYGQVATLAGCAGAARAVGTILRNCSTLDDLPWQRVINSQGRISSGGDMVRPHLQRTLLEREGIEFSRQGTCKLSRFGWEGPQHRLDWE